MDRCRLAVLASSASLLVVATAPAETYEIANGDAAGLSAAIRAANADPAPDIIELAERGVYEVATATDEHRGRNAFPAVTSAIVIRGNGATVRRTADAEQTFRFFLVEREGTLELLSLTLEGGRADAPHVGSFGGAVYGAGPLTLADCTIRGCSAACVGGAIRSSSVLRIRRSTIENNRASQAGAIATDGELVEITDTTIKGNRAQLGGGVATLSGTARLARCTLERNIASVGPDVYALSGSIELDACRTNVASGGDELERQLARRTTRPDRRP